MDSQLDTDTWTPEVAQRLVQARKRRRRGDERKALLLLREACYLSREDPRLWAMYGAQCWALNKPDDARQAFRQALWFRERVKDERRARVLRSLLRAMNSERSPSSLRAA